MAQFRASPMNRESPGQGTRMTFSAPTRLRIPVTAAVTDHPPPICTQQSVTVPPEAGAKFAQPLLYGSDEWQAAYATLRSTNEGMNGFLKDGATEALGDPQRRRIRGVAAQRAPVCCQSSQDRPVPHPSSRRGRRHGPSADPPAPDPGYRRVAPRTATPDHAGHGQSRPGPADRRLREAIAPPQR